MCDQITTDSQLSLSPIISTGSPLELTCMQLTMVNLQFHVSSLINWTLTSACLVTTSTTDINSLNYTYTFFTIPNHSIMNEIID